MMGQVKFTPTDEPRGVFCNENYRLMSCYDGDIIFSYAQKGRAMTAHFSSTKKGLQYAKKAINAFVQWLLINYDIDCVFAIVDKDKSGVIKTVKKCGFTLLAENKEHFAYVRARK